MYGTVYDMLQSLLNDMECGVWCIVKSLKDDDVW